LGRIGEEDNVQHLDWEFWGEDGIGGVFLIEIAGYEMTMIFKFGVAVCSINKDPLLKTINPENQCMYSA
jgi:hypothetical protein